MEDMIKRIVDMDRRARELTDRAKARRTRSAEYVAKHKEKVRLEYETMARNRIEVIRSDEESLAKRRIEESEERHLKNSKRLTELAAEKRDGWIDEIVRRTISSE